MKIAFSTDERIHLAKVILYELNKRGHEVTYIGPESDESVDWPDVTSRAAKMVASGEAEEGIVMCWTGTGASILANKFKGVRAALCRDAETARGARIWNHSNVLALSLRSTSEIVAKEILDAWFNTPFSNDEWNLTQIKKITNIEKNN